MIARRGNPVVDIGTLKADSRGILWYIMVDYRILWHSMVYYGTL